MIWSGVWNRVALLASGLLIGWNLVPYWAAAADRRRDYGIRIFLGAAMGLTLIVALLFTEPAAAILSLIFVAPCAAVAFAANAKQLLKKTPLYPMLTPDRPEVWLDEPLVYLLGAWEPETYADHEAWAALAHRRQELGQDTGSWLGFARRCGRISKGYAANGNRSKSSEALAQLTEKVEIGLSGPIEVRRLSALKLSELSPILRHELADGRRVFCLVPLGLSPTVLTQLHELVNNTRIREAGAVVRYVESTQTGPWLGQEYARLEPLWHSGELPDLALPDEALVDEIVQGIEASLQGG